MAQFENFDQYVEEAMASWSCPGVALAIVRGDEVLHRRVYGLRDVAQELPMTEETRFAMASVTKSFTAMSVALLVDEGKLEWDKPVREYMPEFILDDPYVTQHVTVRDMLSHRTGLPRHDFAAWRLELPRAEFVRRMKHFKFSATFREKFQYNNLMYYVTAYLVEKVSGQKWETFVQERIFTPLGMEASNFEPEPPRPGQVNAAGYRLERGPTGEVLDLVSLPFGQYTLLSPGAAGGLFSTLADLTQWLKVHANEGRVGDLQLVSPNNLQQMHLPQTVIPAGGFRELLLGSTLFTYGMGWFIEPYRGTTLVQHGGNVEGHSLLIGFAPREKVGVVVLTNIGGVPLRDVLLYQALDRALELPEQDWNRRFHEMFDPLLVAEAQSRETAAVERVAEAPPTHSLDSYTGTYAAEGYPDFAVRREGDGFQARTVGSLEWSLLRHYHYNTFEWHLPDMDIWFKVQFQVGETGEIDAASIPIEPMVESIVFTRKLPELSEPLLEQLAGVYNLPIEGLALTVTVREGKVYLAQTGSPPEEIKPYKLNAELVGFRGQGGRLDFVREEGGIRRLVAKMPFSTMEARRRE